MKKNNRKIFDKFILKASEGSTLMYSIIKDSFVFASSLIELQDFESIEEKNEVYSLVFDELILEWDWGDFKLQSDKKIIKNNSIIKNEFVNFDKKLMSALKKEMPYIIKWAKKETLESRASLSTILLPLEMMEYIERIVFFWVGYSEEYIDEDKTGLKEITSIFIEEMTSKVIKKISEQFEAV